MLAPPAARSTCRSQGAVTAIISSQAPNNPGATLHRKGRKPHLRSGPGSCGAPTRPRPPPPASRGAQVRCFNENSFFLTESNRSSLYPPWELWASINKTKQKILESRSSE